MFLPILQLGSYYNTDYYKNAKNISISIYKNSKYLYGAKLDDTLNYDCSSFICKILKDNNIKNNERSSYKIVSQFKDTNKIINNTLILFKFPHNYHIGIVVNDTCYHFTKHGIKSININSIKFKYFKKYIIKICLF